MDINEYLINCDENLVLTSKFSEKLISEDCILGIDEAGRGPVLGPMVYSACFVPISCERDLKLLGCDDSKVLKEEKRDELFDKLNKKTDDYVGWIIHIISPQTISTSMLNTTKYSLNAISHDSAIRLINEALKKGVKVKEVYVDTVGPPDTYQTKLQKIFPNIKIRVEKKADSKFPVVSAASICAKVCRDKVISEWVFKEDQQIDRNYGSGYPSDPVTKAWLRKNLDKVFGFPSFVRFSWSTAKNILDVDGVQVQWSDDEDEVENKKKNKSMNKFLSSSSNEQKQNWFFEKTNISAVDSF